MNGAAEKMGLLNIPPSYGQNRSVEELVLGLNFGSAAAKLPQPMAIDESVPRLGEDERAFSLTPHFVLCLDH
jgi:hypothetical protein